MSAATTAERPVAAPPSRSFTPRSRHSRLTLTWIAEHAFMLALALLFMFPIVFVLLTSFMGPQQTLTGALWPHPFAFSNYSRAFTGAPLARWFANSLEYAGLSTIFMILSSVPAAYVLAKMKFRGSNVIFMCIIFAMLLPPQVTVVPVYVMWSKIGLTGSLWPLILPNLLGDAFSVFLLRQFFLTIPNEYIDAARIDGCGELGTLLRVVVPMSKAGIAASGLFLFFAMWNDYYGPLLYASENASAWPVAYGLATFHSVHGTDWGTTMAITLLVTLPVMIIFFFAQRVFVEGVTLTGVKG
ncbi:MAG: carbohydrate ABC transporter permease [Actinomycetia bacterium]|nr:carbohydrate ABC transporter permease [Actinomycetes bacterium]